MSLNDKNALAYRLVQILRKLNQGEKLEPKALADEFGVSVRSIQHDLNERFHFLNLSKADGRYQLPPVLLGKLTLRDVERFASLAGVRGLYPSLTDDFLRELLDNRVQSALLVKGGAYEDLGGKEVVFHQLEAAIVQHRKVSYTYQKNDSIKSYNLVDPYKLVNHDGIWYLAAVDAGRLKAFTLVKLDRLQISDTAYAWDDAVEKTLAKEDDIWLNAKKVEVVLMVTGAAAGYFRRRKLVSQQVIEQELEDGGLLISARVAHAEQIFRVVREWIPHIRIISPEEWQTDVETQLRTYLGQTTPFVATPR